MYFDNNFHKNSYDTDFEYFFLNSFFDVFAIFGKVGFEIGHKTELVLLFLDDHFKRVNTPNPYPTLFNIFSLCKSNLLVLYKANIYIKISFV